SCVYETGGWFYVDDKYIYYSGGTENYYRCSIKDNEEELLYTYSDSNGYICWSTEFNGKQIIYVRCAFDDPSITFGAKLFELDTETKEVKNVWTDNSKELLVDYNTFKGNDDYFYLTSCYTEGTNCTTYYIITSDYTKKVMFKNSNWKI
ncbi:MAG: hypothetical protein K2F81_02180, partial [Ruminococcus sp.]|nr:hypothetical protein [Ruminococcus sp.]